MRGYLTLLVTLAASWGASFMFIEVALDDLAPTTLMFLRLLVAAVLLLGLMSVKHGARGAARSFRAGLVTYLLPVTALLYGALLLDEHVNGWMLLGLALILSGVALGSGMVRPARTREAVEPARP
jgi:drug/metabolite transporter (DMT)-like permease